jgi:hypothetical protein
MFAEKDPNEEMTLFLSLPFGVDAFTRQEVSSWTAGLPPDVIAQCRLVNRLVNNWPVAVDEDFAFQDAAPAPPRVVVRNTFSYSYMGGLWSGNGYVPNTPYAFLPPVLGLAHEGGLDVDLPQSADSILATKNGPLYMVDGANLCVYEIPGAPAHDVHLIGTNHETIWKQRVDRMIDKRMLNHEMHGVAGVWDPAANWGESASLSMAKSETKDRYVDWMERVTDEIVFGPSSDWQEWTWSGVEDPPSGDWPSFYAYLFATGGRRFPIPGDIDAQTGVVLEYLYESTLWSGDWDGLDAHWQSGTSPTVQEMFEPLQLFQDWSFMASFHDVFGGEGCHMDMFVAQVAGYNAYARMATALGREADARRGQYLAAKAQIPFVTRWIAKDYVKQYYHTLDNYDQIIAGFGEREPSGPLRGTIARAVDAWGDWTISGEHISLLPYDILATVLDGALPSSRPFLDALDRFRDQPAATLFPDNNSILASFPEDKLYAFMKWRNELGISKDDLISWVNSCFTDRLESEPNGSLKGATIRVRDWKVTDWRNQSVTYYDYTTAAQPFPLMPAIVEAYGVPVRIGSWAPAKLVSAEYDPDTHILTADFEQGSRVPSSPNPIVRLQVDAQPTNVSVTGGGGLIDYDPLWHVAEVQLTGSGPWTLTATITPGSGTWQTVDPQLNLAADPGFEESGYNRANLEMPWRQWAPNGQINTTNLTAHTGTHSARLKINGQTADAQIWQYMWWGAENEADLHFWYKIASSDMRLEVVVGEYHNEIGLNHDAYRTVHSEYLTYSECETGWRSYSWRGATGPDSAVVSLLFYVEKDPNATWHPANAHEVFVDDVIVKHPVACTAGTVNVATEYVSGNDTWNATFTFDTEPDTLPVIPVVSCGSAMEQCPCPAARSTVGTLGTHHVIQVTGLKPALSYWYEISGCQSVPAGEFVPAGGPALIRDISHGFISETCQIVVDWKTKFPSHDNELRYRLKGTTPWSTVDAIQPDCSPARVYTAWFTVEAGKTYELQVVTHVEAGQYTSSIYEEHSGKCGGGYIPIDPTSTQPVKAFISAHPNPFNPTTTVSFGVPARMDVEIKVYAADGSYITTLASGTYDRGVHAIEWKATNDRGASLASGIYFVKLNLGDRVLTSKIILLR